MSTFLITPKYINKFNENRKELIASALRYAERDSNFIGLEADKKICEGGHISLRAFRETYTVIGKTRTYCNHVAIFLYDCERREIEYLESARRSKIRALLWHIVDEKDLYLLETKRGKWLLHLSLAMLSAELLEIKLPRAASSIAMVLRPDSSKLREVLNIIFLWEAQKYSANYITKVEKMLKSVNEHEIDNL